MLLALASWARMIWLLTTPCAHWHDFIADALDVGRHVTLRNPHRPDQILDQAAADKIRDYRAPFAIGRWRFCLRACLRGAFIAFFCGCSTSSRTSRRATISRTLAMNHTRNSSAIAVASSSPSIAAPLGLHAPRLLRSVVPPTSRVLPRLEPCSYALLLTTGSAMTCMSVSALKL